jgi:POT family proton-dependent oligopeptide transporter
MTSAPGLPRDTVSPDVARQKSGPAMLQGDMAGTSSTRGSGPGKPLSPEVEPAASQGRRGKYRTAPDSKATGWPKGIPYIIGNEACERFSFYGMRANLVSYLTTLYLATALAQDAAEGRASADVHFFIAGVYALPMIGAIIADKLLGKYLTIMSLSLVYCLGHFVLAFAEPSISGDNTLSVMHLGLLLISIGSGGIKPCVAANVGDQFGESNWHLTKKVFQVFYFSINFGSFFAQLLTPWLLKEFGPSVAFGLPGVLMFLATIIFWWGRYSFVHVPPKPGGKLGLLDSVVSTCLFVGCLGGWMFGHKFGLDTTTIAIVSVCAVAAGVALFFYRQRLAPGEGFLAVLMMTLARGRRHARERFGEEGYDGMLAVFRVLSVILFVSVFWTLFDQHSTTWVLQAQQMDLNVLGWQMLPQQSQSMNPLLVLTLIPVFTFVVFPWMERRGIAITPLRRMSVGMFLAASSFVASAMIQVELDAGVQMHVAWQFIPYFLITAGEVLVSATGLEFAYSQAPRAMKSTLMAFWNLTVSFGNVLAAFAIGILANQPRNVLFWYCAAGMAVVGVAFTVRAYFYRYRDYAQR